jgi:hypothetical protein
MKVICISNVAHWEDFPERLRPSKKLSTPKTWENGVTFDLTIGKIYDVKIFGPYQFVVDDSGKQEHCIPKLFKRLDVLREEKIISILD